MLNELRQYSNLGTPSYFFQLLSELKNGKVAWNEHNVIRLFQNKVVEGKRIFDGCLNLAYKINLLALTDERITIVDSVKDHLNSLHQLSDKIIELFFIRLKEEEQLYDIFSSKHLKYDVIYKSPQLNYAAFSFKYSNIKQFLLDFGFIELHPIPELDSFLINSRYHRLFDKLLLPEIKKRKIGLEELKRKLELQKTNGEEGEMFVLSFEKKRLENKKQVQWIAQYIANQGYDIASYNSATDEQPNRFIEVKSYEGDLPYFFWSRNEYIQAKSKKNTYWLYLVNRKFISDDDYYPMMIQNPFENILMNDKWDKQIDKYKITLLPT